jgi:hypothetical protein
VFKVMPRDALEVYISEKHYVCLKQTNPMEREAAIVALEPGLARQVAQWLIQLADEAEPHFQQIEIEDLVDITAPRPAE